MRFLTHHQSGITVATTSFKKKLNSSEGILRSDTINRIQIELNKIKKSLRIESQSSAENYSGTLQ